MPPGPDTRVKITEEYARHVARDAFFWAWPLVNIYNRRLACRRSKELICRARAGRAAQPHRHAHRLCRSGGAHRRLPEPGRGLWRRLAGARSFAGRDPGAGLRRPLLGLSGRRSAHRQLRPARQDVRHHAGLLPAGRSGLARRRAEGHHQGLPRLDQHRLRRAARISRTTRRRTSRRSSRVLPADHDVPARGIRRHG